MEKELKPVFILFIIAFFLGGITLLSAGSPQPREDQSFIKEELAWRTNRDSQMRAPTSWLTIAGLFWLDEGDNSFGTAAENKIKLPSGSAAAYAGKFNLNKGKITVVANKDTELKNGGKVIKEMPLKGDDSGRPDIVELNVLRMWVIKRGDRYAIRLRDLNNPAFKNYKGLDFFAPSKEFKIEAGFFPYKSAKKVSVSTIIGTQTEMSSPGYVKFKLGGRQHSLEAFRGSAENTKLFFVFKDETNGKETYEASRFMVADILENGKVDLNFNRAYNPPCAYTPFATCPLPPPQNYLKVRIEAGEKKYPGGHH